MARSNATTVEDYLHELPPDRRAVVSAVRDVILRHLPAGYRETMNWGMISYEVPLESYPGAPGGQPLSYVCLAAQKNHYALYLMCVCGNAQRQAWLKAEFGKAGRKLDMGKSCLRFRRLEDLPLEVIGSVVASATPEQYIAGYEATRRK